MLTEFTPTTLPTSQNSIHPVRVVNGQGDLGKAQGPALGGAAEDNVLHFRAAQGTQGLFAQDPAHGVADIAFAAAIGAHHRGDAPLEGEGSFVGEGFEALQVKGFEKHEVNSEKRMVGQG